MSTAGSEGRKSQPGCDEASSAGDSGTKPRMSLTGTGAVSRKSQQGGSTQQPLVATSTGHEHGGQEAVAATQGSQNMEVSKSHARCACAFACLITVATAHMLY